MQRGRLIPAAVAGLFTLVLISLDPTNASAASYAKFDGIDGESTAAGDPHKDWINLLSVSFGGVRRAGATADQVRPPRGKGPGTIRMTKSSDWASTRLMRQMSAGTQIPKVVIYREMPGKAETYMKYELENVMITSYNTGGSAAGDVPMEEISLNYEKISWSAATDKPWAGPRELTLRPARKIEKN